MIINLLLSKSLQICASVIERMSKDTPILLSNPLSIPLVQEENVYGDNQYQDLEKEAKLQIMQRLT